jgi:hypothetical protein
MADLLSSILHLLSSVLGYIVPSSQTASTCGIMSAGGLGGMRRDARLRINQHSRERERCSILRRIHADPSLQNDRWPVEGKG